MKDIKGTKTEKNLETAFAGESMARNKYDYYASQAKKGGYVQISKIFEENALNEHQHAKLWFRYLHGGKLPETVEALKDAAAGEHYEWTEMYTKMAEEAREEGFDEIADRFEHVGYVEKEHEKRYLALLETIENGKVFKRDSVVRWKCNNCGYIYEGEEAPKVCPACLHPQAHFEVNVESYAQENSEVLAKEW